MKPGARICTVAGGAGPPDGAESAADCAARGAVTELTRGAAAALAARGVAVNGVNVARRARTDDGQCGRSRIADGVAEAIA